MESHQRPEPDAALEQQVEAVRTPDGAVESGTPFTSRNRDGDLLRQHRDTTGGISALFKELVDGFYGGIQAYSQAMLAGMRRRWQRSMPTRRGDAGIAAGSGATPCRDTTPGPSVLGHSITERRLGSCSLCPHSRAD